MVCCVVQTCTRRSETSNRKRDGVSFHAFPKDPILGKEWTKFCRRAPSWQPKRTSVICSEHFKPSNFQTLANQRRLVENAIPSILPSSCKNSRVVKSEPQTQQDSQPSAPSPITATNMQQNKQSRLSNSTNSSISDKLKIQLIENNCKRKLLSKNQQIKKLQDNNRYLKIKVNNLQTVCARLKKLLTKKMEHE